MKVCIQLYFCTVIYRTKIGLSCRLCIFVLARVDKLAKKKQNQFNMTKIGKKINKREESEIINVPVTE